jgi:hypothetical protein
VRGIAAALTGLLLVACSHAPAPDRGATFARLRAAFVAPAGFTTASPAGPCSSAENMECWTTAALPSAAARAAVTQLGPDFQVTDTSWCGPEHWAAQRKAWGEAHTPCTLYGRWHGAQVIVGAIAFPHKAASRPGRLVFPPTLVSISAS